MTQIPMVHIVDDDSAVRDALTLLMQSDNVPCQAYNSAEDFLEKHAQLKLGCLLLDVRMPGMSGLQLMDELIKQNISIPVIFITGHGDVAMAVAAMKEGATDFIEKPFDNDYLLEKVHSCLTDCICLDSTNELQSQMHARLALLTKRETQVMNLLVDGKQNKIIADELNISVRTVELHRAKVMEKLQAHSLSDVVRTALQAS